MGRKKRWIRVGALLSLFTWGCQTFTPITPGELPQAPERDGAVRVTTTSGEEVLLANARIWEDRIVGDTEFGERSIALDEVVTMEAREMSETRVLLITLGATLVLGALIIGFVQEDNPPAPGG